MTVEIRRATPADLPALLVADGRAFGYHHNADDHADVEKLLDLDRFLLAVDPERDGALVGNTGSYAFDVTLPGGATLPTPGVTWVFVDGTYRRRGILRSLMTAQHRGFLADGVAMAVLTASESSIYGRFGYGVVTRTRRVEIARNQVRIRPDAPDPGGVHYAEGEEICAVAPELHRRWCAVTPGAVSRDDAWWQRFRLDRPHQRRGGTARFHLVHPEGFATYRVKYGSATSLVAEVFACTDAAHTALWRVLLEKDLVDTVVGESCPVDDPLPYLLTDPRRLTTTGLRDGMWARILDVAAVLGARRYATEIDTVLEVTDPFLGRGGRFRLAGGPDGATCEPVTSSADVHVDVADLASLTFGTVTATTLSRAGLLTARSPSVLGRVGTAFGTDREAVHGTEF